jgi:predicted ATPase/class 3 adenylate cyclase
MVPARWHYWNDGAMGAKQGLPTGTVTMLFTDIEGSTGLLTRLGDRYAEVLSVHRQLMRDAFAAGGGWEVGTEGDSFFVVFESADGAVRSCLEAQRALLSYEWPGGESVRVRMGLHSGEPVRDDDDYVGIDVNRAARIAACAHGGQVVLSEATRVLVEGRLPPGVSVHDLGWHRLKDIEAAEHLYQLAAAGLGERFPPLRSLGASTGLPVPPTPLVGRQEDVEQLHAMILRPGIRLVTLTGTGGIGKTRLALAVASSIQQWFPSDVFFVPLAAVSNADVMWKTIAETLNVSGDRPAADAVTEHLRPGRFLLILDNLEQLAEAGGVVAELMAAAPKLVVLATSRRPLHVPGEQEWPVPPLPVPAESNPGPEELDTCAATQLFIQQAAMVRPGFTVTPQNAADIAAICRRLDGLPLAIELAAARAKLLTPKAILARLGQSLALAAGSTGRPSRQQTLRDTIAWSYDLLSPDLQVMFRRTGVFAGGCDLEAFSAVAMADRDVSADGDPLHWVGELLDVSLVSITEGRDGEPRVRLLETLRQYALERLAQEDDLEAARRRHAEYYAGFAEQARDRLDGRTHWAWLDRLEIEHDNLQDALSWALTQRPADNDDGSQVSIGLRLVQALAPFWYQHGHAKKAQQWLERAVEIASDAAGAPLARIAHWLGVIRQQQGENATAIPLFRQSLAIWQDLGDQTQMARELNSLGITYRSLGDLATARLFFEDSIAIARKIGNDLRLSTALANLGIAEIDAGNVDHATEVLEEALALDEKNGDTWGATIVKNSLATATLLTGRPTEAHHLLSSIIKDVADSGDLELLAATLELAAGVASHLGNSHRAARLAGAAEGIRDKAGIPITEFDAALLERFLAPARSAADRSLWEADLHAGRALTNSEATALVAQPLTTGSLAAQDASP